ncbi:alpha/beta hydrolase [Alicyclobacillus sp. ALC3]|uniref:alpha/beta hydrolase n=1 Tax=Alicyclobacillus sp. ALC3 TaxID=2796143 RepID=UPI002379E33E|nr:alpha/beta hydrolase [Alicyclobacillus sp. ALC3]WDL95652.1 alpha/beta hydrolase [Alicyclobacillus sp. ALC3]
MPSEESLKFRQMLMEQRAQMAKVFATHQPTLEQERAGMEAAWSQVAVLTDVTVEPTTFAGMHAEWVSAPNSRLDSALLYLHGGAYYMGSVVSHREIASRLARACAMRVLVIEYRLAPEHPYPAAVEDSVTAYRELVESGIRPENIVIAGDSAGGGLTVATLVALRDRGYALPTNAVAMSPWTDLECTGGSMVTRAPFDPMLTPESVRGITHHYVGEADPRSPLISPIYADLSGLPPMLIHVGHDEVLLDDAIRLSDRLNAAGVAAGVKVWEGMWHVFQSFAAYVPESQQAIDEIGNFVQSKLPANAK